MRAINQKMSKGFDFDEKQRRQELADFLRTRRSKISPLTVGLPESARKRTPGLSYQNRRNDSRAVS